MFVRVGKNNKEESSIKLEIFVAIIIPYWNQWRGSDEPASPPESAEMCRGSLQRELWLPESTGHWCLMNFSRSQIVEHTSRCQPEERRPFLCPEMWQGVWFAWSWALKSWLSSSWRDSRQVRPGTVCQFWESDPSETTELPKTQSRKNGCF